MDVFSPISAGLGFANSAYSHDLGRDDARFANDMAIGNWRLQNDYNSPAALVNRLKAAGLNPNLAIGGAMSPSSPIGSAAQVSHDAPSSIPIGEGIGDYVMQSKQLAMAEKLNDAEVERTKAETKEIQARTPGHNTNRLIQESEEERNKIRFEHEKLMQSYEELLKGFEVDEATYQYNIRDTRRGYELNQLQHEYDLSESQVKLSQMEVNFAIDSYYQRLRSLKLTNENLEKQGDQIEANIDKIKGETQLLLGEFAEIAPLAQHVEKDKDGNYTIKKGHEAALYHDLYLFSSRNSKDVKLVIKMLKALFTKRL